MEAQTHSGGNMIGKIATWLIPEITTVEFIAICIFAFAFGVNTDQISIALWALGSLIFWFVIRFLADVGAWLKKKWPDRPSCSKY